MRSLAVESFGIEYCIALLILLLGTVSACLLRVRSLRQAKDVLADLKSLKIDDQTIISSEQKSVVNRSVRGFIFGDELAKAGYISLKARKKYKRLQRVTPFIGAGLAGLLWSIFGPYNIFAGLYALILGAGLGVFYLRFKLHADSARYQRTIEFFLPLIMERIVMAVQAGLDILPALKVVLEHNSADKLDPISELLSLVVRLTESGLSFEDALRDVADAVECSALKHAFIHLGLAQRQGGELVMPLRELSDSTQLYYQESVEEMIAKMPAKATMPLICTFLGLLLTFLTTPLLQVLSLLQRGAGL